MNFFKLSLQFQGFPIEKATRTLKTIQKSIATDYNSYLETKKQDIVNYHLKNNAFYKGFVNAEAYTNWNTLPVMTKADLQQPLNDRLSEGFSKKNIYLNKTSGSSGTPFLFAKDKFCHALIWANFVDRYKWFDLDLHSSKQARFYGIPLDKKGYYKERLKDKLSNRFRFSVFDLSDDQLEKNIGIFQSSAFDYINGYTSAIVQFAKYLKKKNIVLKTICPSLKACIVTSEMLFESDKTLLESQFGIPIINEYGNAELGLIAFQNKKKEWLVNNEDLYVEILDDNDRILPLGEIGRIVITSLYNKAHPFIRYDLGDLGALSEDSTPEKPILKSLQGRTSDLVQLPSGKTAAGLTFYYVTKTIIEDKSTVKEFVIEQLKLDTFKIRYVSDETLSEEKIKAVKKAISNYLEPNLNIIFEHTTQLERSNRGKLKQFSSYL
ncbi:phenylacetate--CoA ligase family protein [Tamlana agarivorans]|uniref:Phenylacetate--CoA ligase family protein n=1 Tax=Pseudotamlana agarivorans TaxID=481183 RepID=A0ACC5U5T1_9FLAO|nr:phenylacetate--CoA ligase family protein [Tamlana agarivorans]MBU2949613.1 phenylacetate--CoA ligase family protein [Tamlana agarivorans]